MTAQEYLDELERLRKAAIMPPYYLRKKLFFGRAHHLPDEIHVHRTG